MAIMVLLLQLFVVVVVLAWSLEWLYRECWRPKVLERRLRKQGIKGQSYRLLRGNDIEKYKLVTTAMSKPMDLSHDIVGRVDPSFQKLLTAYPKERAILTWRATTPILNIIDPMLIREMLTEKNYELRKVEVNSSMKYFTNGLANHDGEKWAKHRKIVTPAFHIEKLKRMMPAFLTSCEEMIQKWNNLVASSGGSCEVNVVPEFRDLTADIISKAVFGSNIKEGRMIFKLQNQLAELFFKSFFTPEFPWSRFVSNQTHKKMKRVHEEVGSILTGMIESREKAIKLGKRETDDLLSLLLKSNLKEIEEGGNSSRGMTRDDVIEECKLFYFAGHETTANLLSWTMVALGMHSDWQQKAREEILLVLGKKRPTFDDLKHLKIVNMILLETLRLYPATSLSRSTHNEVKIGELVFPAGIVLQVPVFQVQRNPEIWGEDATEFNPGRFEEGVSKASKEQASFFAFGWGPRICIGQNFAMREAKLALCLILQHFSFELSPNYKHAPFVALTLQPQFGAQIILHKI